MLSYPVDEAETLLESKLSTAKTSLSNCEEDLDFLREQITVTFGTRARRARSRILIIHRLWKSPSREYTTGRWFKSGKIRKKERISRRKRTRIRLAVKKRKARYQTKKNLMIFCHFLHNRNFMAQHKPAAMFLYRDDPDRWAVGSSDGPVGLRITTRVMYP